MEEKVLSKRKIREGVVLSDKMDKTIVVQVTRTTPHPRYGKVLRRHKKFKAHDPKNEAKIGDVVRIIETRPISKEKRWALLEIISKATRKAPGEAEL